MLRRLFFGPNQLVCEHITKSCFLSGNLAIFFQVFLDFYDLIEKFLQAISLTRKQLIELYLLRVDDRQGVRSNKSDYLLWHASHHGF